MPINVIMPQMGESILEGTVTKWLKKIGDRVKKEESLFEVSTDKVDTEVPSPADGVLKQIVVNEGETVQVNTVVAILESASEATAEPSGVPATGGASEAAAPPTKEATPAADSAAEASEPVKSDTGPEVPLAAEPSKRETVAEVPSLPEPEKSEAVAESPTVEEPSKTESAEETPAAVESPESAPPVEVPAEKSAFVRTSPLVRRIARDYDVDLSKVRGTGFSGRIRQEDILDYLEKTRPPATPQKAAPAVTPVEKPVAATVPIVPARDEAKPMQPPKPAVIAAPAKPEEMPAKPPRPVEVPGPQEDVEIVTMSPMRKAIAEHMVLSKHTSAHVQTVFEVDMTAVLRLREKHADEFEARTGISLTYTPFFAKALIETVRAFPILNSSVSGDKILLKKSVNLGIAVALDTGLIVPVVMNAHLKTFSDLALAIHDLAKRARTKKLKPEEVQHGTITITNPGIFGSLFGLPIINQPQTAILCVGSLEKRPVVINDAIAIRTMVYLVLSFDHRIIDGAVADQSMAALKSKLQSWNAWRE